LALAVPALGGPSNPVAGISANAKKTAKKALKKAKAAQSSADNAQNTANGAQTSADNAQTAADSANTAAQAAQATADSKLGSTEFVSGDTTAENASTKTSTAACPAGTQPTGGGYGLGGANPQDATTSFSGSALYGGGWASSAREIDGQAGTWTITATAVCAGTSAPAP
jgi:hypothetical protein